MANGTPLNKCREFSLATIKSSKVWLGIASIYKYWLQPKIVINSWASFHPMSRDNAPYIAWILSRWSFPTCKSVFSFQENNHRAAVPYNLKSVRVTDEIVCLTQRHPIWSARPIWFLNCNRFLCKVSLCPLKYPAGCQSFSTLYPGYRVY